MKIMVQDIKEKIEIKVGLFQKFLKKVGFVIFILFIFVSQVYLLSAYEAHVINVTARICIPLETRTPGYWKTHPEVYQYYLPQYLGSDSTTTCPWYVNVDSTAIADEVFWGCDAVDMREKLKCHLLAMKFNVAHYGVGDYFATTCTLPDTGREIIINRTINQLVLDADAILCNSGATREQLEEIKDMLDCLNNLHEIRECASPASLLSRFSPDVEISISEEIATTTLSIENTTTTGGQIEAGTSTPPEETPPDTTPPVITLIGSDTINIYVGDSYVDAGATASDDVDGDITAKIIVVNPVDTNITGTYIITYNVSDTAGNSAAEVTRTVIVSEKPAPPETPPPETPPPETPPPETPPEETPPETMPETNQTNNNATSTE